MPHTIGVEGCVKEITNLELVCMAPFMIYDFKRNLEMICAHFRKKEISKSHLGKKSGILEVVARDKTIQIVCFCFNFHFNSWKSHSLAPRTDLINNVLAAALACGHPSL